MAADHHFWKLPENRQFFIRTKLLLWNWGYPVFKPTHLPSIFRHCDEEWKPSLPEECVQRSNSHGADAHSRSGSRSGSRSNSRNDTPRDAEMKAGHHYASLIWSVQLGAVLLFWYPSIPHFETRPSVGFTG